MRSLTVVAYAVNGAGLGHLTRVLAVLRWMRRIARFAGIHLEVFILTTSEASELVLREGFAAFKIPSKTAIREAGISKENYLRLARQWIWHSISLLKPDLLLVDTFPGGTFGELGPVLDVPAKKIFICRAVKDSFAQLDGYKDFLKWYDRIIVVHEKTIIFPEVFEEFMDRVKKVAPILLRESKEYRSPDEARKRLGIPPDAFAVWVSAGGGGDPTVETTLTAIVEELRQYPDTWIVVGVGPLYRGTPFNGRQLQTVNSPHAALDFPAFNAAISAAGFNSFYELLDAGLPTAFFGQEKIADDQKRRLAQYIDNDYYFRIELGTDGRPEPTSLAAAVKGLHSLRRKPYRPDPPYSHPDTSGALKAAESILETILNRSQIDFATELLETEFGDHLLREAVDMDLVLEIPTLFQSAYGNGVDAICDTLEIVVADAREPFLTQRIRLFLALAKPMSRQSNSTQAEFLTKRLTTIVDGLMKFGDERAANAFVRIYPVGPLETLEKVSAALTDFFDALRDTGESLWRGMAILGRLQNQPECSRDFPSIVEKATEEVRDEQRI